MLSKNGKNIKELKRIDSTVVKNIVKIIRENDSIRKTPLLEKTNLDYPRLNAYIKWLEH